MARRSVSGQLAYAQLAYLGDMCLLCGQVEITEVTGSRPACPAVHSARESQEENACDLVWWELSKSGHIDQGHQGSTKLGGFMRLFWGLGKGLHLDGHSTKDSEVSQC